MAKRCKVEGYQAFIDKVTALEKEGRTVYCMFCGSKDKSGESWCPDCVTAEPVVEECLKNLPTSAFFLFCSVGERDYWKNKTNEFRTDKRLMLSGVPTLLKWGQPNQKLAEEQLFKPDLINMLFED